MAGVPLLPGILPAAARVIVEIPWGANLNADASNWPLSTPWVDITTDVWQAGIGQPLTISPMGRSDRFNQAQPAGCTFVLDNTTGKYSKGPASSNWPFVRPNTPVRVSVTLNGITIFTRFFGYIEAWEPHDDETTKTAWVNVTAWGKMHTLDLVNKPIRSPLTRAVLGDATTYGLYQYWACEDEVSSTQAGSALSGGVPLIFVGTPVVAGLNPDTVNGVFGSTWLGAGQPAQGILPMPRLDNGAKMTASFPAGNASAWTVQFAAWTDINEPTDTPTLDRTFAQWETPGGTYVKWQVIADYNDPTFGTVVKVVATKADGTTSQLEFDGILSSFLVEYWVSAQQSGGNISVSFGMRGSWHTTSGTFSTATLAGVTSFTANPLAQVTTDLFAISQARIWNQANVPPYQSYPPTPGSPVAWYSYWTENPVTRLTRLCAQEGGLGCPLVASGTSNLQMGTQSVGKFVDVIRECETADGGVLFDGMSQGLNYVSRSAKYNQAASLTLNATAGQIDPPFEPKDQDPQRRNLWVIGRRGGSSATVTDKTGPLGTDAIGPLSKSVNDLNLASDAELTNIGGWLLRLGTVDQPYYYPTLKLDLSAIPSKAFDWLSTGIGERIDITNLSTLSSRHPPGTLSLILEGYTETIAPYEWSVTANCSPYAPWAVDALNQTFRLEFAAQTLAADLLAGDTTLSLATAAGHCLFTTTAKYPADFNLDVNVGGWPVTVTAASGTSSPQTLTINAAPGMSGPSNPFFETTAAPWVAINGATRARTNALAHEGAWSLLVTPDGVTADPTVRSEAFPVVGNKPYQLHSWAATPSAGGVTRRVAVEWQDVNGAVISTDLVSINLATANTWFEYGPSTFTAPSNAAQAVIVSSGSGVVNSPWYLDQATLKQITPAGTAVTLWRPAALAL